MSRDYNYDIMPEMQKRYATRSFVADPIPRDDLLAMFEAARYAPSCFNEQPWRFIYGDTPEKQEKLRQTLLPGNAWAKAAPVLILVLCTRNFKLNGKPNDFARFDTGTASGFLQLEAVRRGYAVHCMAGFDAQKARELFALPEDLDIIEMIAVGRMGDISALPEDLLSKEAPGTRNPLESLFL